MTAHPVRAIVLCADWCSQCRRLRSECLDLLWIDWLDIEDLDIDVGAIGLKTFPFMIVLDEARTVRHAGHVRGNRTSVIMTASAMAHRDPSLVHPLVLEIADQHL